jgi:hypothetical protein
VPPRQPPPFDRPQLLKRNIYGGAHCRGEFGKCKWLVDGLCLARQQTTMHDSVGWKACRVEDWQILMPLLGCLDQFRAVHSRKLDIGKEQCNGGMRIQRHQGCLCVSRGNDAVPQRFQRLHSVSQNVSIVLYHKHCLVVPGPWRVGWCNLGFRRLNDWSGYASGQVQLCGRARTEFAVDFDMAARLFDEPEDL